MKRYSVILLVFGILALGCKSTKMSSSSQSGKSELEKLEGAWELNYISAPGSSFEALYKEKKPQISFDVKENKFSGNSSCNSFAGKLIAEGNKIDFTQPFMMTKMFCPGEGESTFVETLKKVNKYTVSDENTLNFISGDIAIMRFTRK